MRKLKKKKTLAQKRSAAAKKGWKTRRAKEEYEAGMKRYRQILKSAIKGTLPPDPNNITAPQEYGKGKSTGYRPYW